MAQNDKQKAVGGKYFFDRLKNAVVGIFKTADGGSVRIEGKTQHEVNTKAKQKLK